jgi:hypothetical protein
MDMHTIHNELTCYLRRKRNSSERPWLAVQERAHGIAAVGYVSDAQLNGFERLFKGRISMANADGHASLDQSSNDRRSAG